MGCVDSRTRTRPIRFSAGDARAPKKLSGTRLGRRLRLCLAKCRSFFKAPAANRMGRARCAVASPPFFADSDFREKERCSGCGISFFMQFLRGGGEALAFAL